MERWQCEELAELILRYAAARVADDRALHAVRPDMDEWTRSGDACQQASRELWQALYSIEISEPQQRPERVVKLPSSREGTAN